MKERQAYKMICYPLLWNEKVDDTYAITSHNVVKTLEELANKNIKFTIKSAEEGKLVFLNCLKSVNENRELRTEVYRKSTHTGQYNPFARKQS